MSKRGYTEFMKFFSKLLKFIFSRIFIVGTLIAVQIVSLVVLIVVLGDNFVYVYVVLVAFSGFMVFWIIGKKDNPSLKVPWLVVILLLPIFGGLFYLILGRARLPEKHRKNMIAINKRLKPYYPVNDNSYEKLKAIDIQAFRQSCYLKNTIGMPLYENTTCEYLKLGESKFERLKLELEKAKHYIFIEYFIIKEGKMWDCLLEILVRKVKEGVLVRVMYDDIGCLKALPYKYYSKLIEMGIKCTVFNPFRPSLSPSLQNRDHRKILVIDGHTGFTGGINIADEYINEVERFGHWKDCAVMLKGEAVCSLTLMFLEMWNFYSPEDEDYEKYAPKKYHSTDFDNDGFVMPYGDTPLDDEYVSESVYLNIINSCTDYLYINTPYFVVDNEMVTALTLAAKRGVDVRIVTPHIPDKWYVHIMTQSYYPQLIGAGIKIYEYMPGFMHSKTFVADDKIATIGTVNLDYRSLYHHFECGVWLYKNNAVMELKQDFLNTLKVCENISLEQSLKVSLIKRVFRSVLRLVAPLM